MRSPSTSSWIKPSSLAWAEEMELAFRINGQAFSIPINLGSLWVPPFPGMMPSLGSGCETKTFCPFVAIRAVQDMAISFPPPKARPFMAQTTGFPKFSIRFNTAMLFRQKVSASCGVFCAASIPISAPETKALVPNPVRMAPLIFGSFWISRMISRSCSKTSAFKAFRTFGLRILTMATSPLSSLKTTGIFHGCPEAACFIKISSTLKPGFSFA